MLYFAPRTAPTTPPTAQQASMIRRYIIWRDNHAYDQRLRRSSTGQALPDAREHVLGPQQTLETVKHHLKPPSSLARQPSAWTPGHVSG